MSVKAQASSRPCTKHLQPTSTKRCILHANTNSTSVPFYSGCCIRDEWTMPCLWGVQATMFASYGSRFTWTDSLGCRGCSCLCLQRRLECLGKPQCPKAESSTALRRHAAICGPTVLLYQNQNHTHPGSGPRLQQGLQCPL